jgi:glycyl-tRNA synthetase beta chain
LFLLTKDFLLEIGTEEIPAGYLKDAISFIEECFKQFLQTSRLTSNKVITTFTPRRLTLIANGLQAKQEDLDIVKTGPARKIAFLEDGTPSPALDGFLRNNKATRDDVFFQDSPKGEITAIRIKQTGLPTEELLLQWMQTLLAAIPFPKRMKWGSGSSDFARPVRWIVCLWGDEILPFKSGNISSGRTSMGNRFLGLNTSIEIANSNDYFHALKQVSVFADRQERYELIKQQLQDIFIGTDYNVDINEGLLQTVTDLVEYPNAVIAEFEERFRILPEKIITSTISQNQKYFAVMDKAGKLTNKFVFISNGNPEHSSLIRRGNEKVVKPRLEDAMWYYQEDTKHKLEEYVPALSNVVFQAELGTLLEKTDRIINICTYVCKLLSLSEKELPTAQRTALLCKADLVTKMLGEKEFTKLQGYIGMHYALASGENEDVAQGIYEHYMPRGQNDAISQTLNGAIVAVADKLDTVCGIIGIGMLPTGSADPYALRRAANGIVQIIAERKWNINIVDIISYSLNQYNKLGLDKPETNQVIQGFFHQRINWYLQQQSIEYDVIDSVMHIEFGNILHLLERAKAVQDFKANEDFIKLVIGFKRVSNIIKDEKAQLSIKESLFTEQAETKLFTTLGLLESKIEAELEKLNYTQVLNQLVSIRPVIDKFFDDVLVNTDDDKLRLNRYALLLEIRKAFLQVADISLLVVEGKG